PGGGSRSRRSRLAGGGSARECAPAKRRGPRAIRRCASPERVLWLGGYRTRKLHSQRPHCNRVGGRHEPRPRTPSHAGGESQAPRVRTYRRRHRQQAEDQVGRGRKSRKNSSRNRGGEGAKKSNGGGRAGLEPAPEAPSSPPEPAPEAGATD